MLATITIAPYAKVPSSHKSPSYPFSGAGDSLNVKKEIPKTTEDIPKPYNIHFQKINVEKH